MEDEARSGLHSPQPDQQHPDPDDDRGNRPHQHGDELVLRQQQHVVEPGLLTAAIVVLTEPVEEGAVGGDGAGRQSVEIGEQRREEHREDEETGNQRRR